MKPFWQRVNPNTDSLLLAIAKLGGIARDEVPEFEDDFLRREKGLYVFRKNGGKSLDHMAESLGEYDYPVFSAETTGSCRHGYEYRQMPNINKLRELIDGELRGKPAVYFGYNPDQTEMLDHGLAILRGLADEYGCSGDIPWDDIPAFQAPRLGVDRFKIPPEFNIVPGVNRFKIPPEFQDLFEDAPF